jgi:sulfopyruvate decarboxylase TPP-binding subunit
LSQRPTAPGGKALFEALQRCGIDHITTVPDFVQLSLHEKLDAPDSGFKVTYCANENQALQVSSGLYIGGKKTATLMQNQGLYNCMNTLRACGLDANIPLLMLIGQFGREFDNVGKDSRLSRRRMVNWMTPILDAATVPHWEIESDADIGKLEQAWQHSRQHKVPVAVVIGNYTLWD